MKKLLFAIGFGLISFVGFSQERQPGSELSIGLEGGLPVGSLHDYYGSVYGATLKYAYNFDETIAVTLQSGYNRFNGKNYTFSGLGQSITYKAPSINMIPAKVGVRFSMGPLYAEPQIGAGFFSGDGQSKTSFIYAGNIGVLAGQNFDISLKYEGWSGNYDDFSTDSKKKNFGFVGIRLAYNIPLSK